MAGGIELTFLGSGNAFAPEGRAFSSFILNRRYLFDCGPTVLQQLSKARIPSNEIAAVFISHFHGDHFFGLPFLFLDRWYKRGPGSGEFSATGSADVPSITIVGPPGIEERTERLMELAFPSLPRKPFRREYTEVRDGIEADAAGLQFTAARVEHVSELECFAYRVRLDGRSLVFSGDARMCEPLLRIARGADVLVLECACVPAEVHLSAADVAEIARQAPGARTIVTHHDLMERPPELSGMQLADDLVRFVL